MAALDIIGTIDLNKMPDLSNAEITEKLINNKFMSDVEFRIDDQVLYAHSWELMKRSVVFQSQMQATMGKYKLITIEDTCYDVFYQFIRFIYTDMCEVNVNNEIELLKLARKYKVIKLETKLINESCATLKLFEYCVLEKYELAYQMAREKLSCDVSLIKHNFLNVDSSVMEELLKFDCLKIFGEHELFEILMMWMNKSCETNQIPLTQRRSHFDKFIRLVRFPAMTGSEFSICVQKHPDLLTNEDILTIFKQISIGADSLDSTWIAKRRLRTDEMFMFEHNWWHYRHLKISFSVSTNTTLSGLRLAKPETLNSNCLITIITAEVPDSDEHDIKTFNFYLKKENDISTFVNFGESIVLKPDIEYKMELRLQNLRTDASYNFSMRNDCKDLILSGPPNVFQNLHTDSRLFEIIYKSVTN